VRAGVHRAAAGGITPAIDLFHRYLPEERPPDACWIWRGSTTAYGYGNIRVGGRGTQVAIYAHRLAYEYFVGPIPPGLLVCHACDNPPCTNPAHLWLGTPADNMHDRDRKGRHRWTRGDRIAGV